MVMKENLKVHGHISDKKKQNTHDSAVCKDKKLLNNLVILYFNVSRIYNFSLFCYLVSQCDFDKIL
jgi:hypothetical protein